MTTLAEFRVLGDPSPQGSKTRMPNGAIVEGKTAGQRAKHSNWRSAVAHAAQDAARDLHGPLDGSLGLAVEFRFAMPASRSKAVRIAGRAPKSSAPDLDKLVRAVGDALKAGGLIVDDARFCAIEARKVEVVGWTGAIVAITDEAAL